MLSRLSRRATSHPATTSTRLREWSKKLSRVFWLGKTLFIKRKKQSRTSKVIIKTKKQLFMKK